MNPIDNIMAQAQVFASAWALAGGRFDSGDGFEIAEQEKQALRAAIEHALSARVPDGWNLVPVEPTEEMLSEGSCAQSLPGPHYISESAAAQCWAYMLAAAPEALQPKRVPLTDDEIEEINGSLTGRRDLARLFARAIERAHGITGETK